MSTRSNNFKIGLFVVVFFLLLSGLLIFLGAGEVFKPKAKMETYFDRSVTGVTVGSPLRFRGVAIGSVSEIQFATNRYPEEVTEFSRNNYVVVIMEVQTEIFGELSEARMREVLPKLVPEGWRVRMNKSGLTGSAYLEIDRIDDAPDPLPVPWEPKLPYIPSAPAVLSELLDSVQQILDKLEAIDLEASNQELQKLLAEATAGVQDLRGLEVQPVLKEVTKAVKEIKLAAADFREAVKDLDGKINEADVEGISTGARDIIAELRTTNERLAETIEQVNTTTKTAINPEEISEVVDSIQDVTRQLKEITSDLSQNPGALISEPPPPAKLRR